MGNAKSGPAVGDGKDVVASEEDAASVRRFAKITYAVGIGLWCLLWLAFMYSMSWEAPAALLGFAFGLVVLLLNLLHSGVETISTYEAEVSELRSLEGNAFYISAALFAFGSVVVAVQDEHASVRRLLPVLMATLFFTVCVVLAPVWNSTVFPVDTIKEKHVKSVAAIYGLALMATVLAVILCYEVDKASGRFVRRAWSGGFVGAVGRQAVSMISAPPEEPLAAGLTAAG